MKLRVPLVAPSGRPLRAVAAARFSTEEQDVSSNADQFAYCKKNLDAQDVNYVVEEISDEEMSGELRDRPGINQVRARIAAHACDLIIAEDSSRLFRNHTACFEFIEWAVDEGIRVWCVNDFVDTAEEGWELRLHEAQRHHCEFNRYLRLRTKRKFDGLWASNAAVGPLRPGYRRVATEPATEEKEEKGPFYDSNDPQWEPVIYEGFERVARRDPPWLVVQWLTQTGLPRWNGVTEEPWTEEKLRRLIRTTDYRGLEEHGKTKLVRKRRTGKKKQVPNKPEDVQTRPMPHLRMVPDWLWYKANQAIDERTKCPNPPRGPDHPLAGIPRDSRTPLANRFFCGICGRKMYVEGRNAGGYRCSGAKKCDCWSKATALRQLTHEQIGKAICERILALEGSLTAVVDYVASLLQDDSPLRDERECLIKQRADLQRRCQRLAQAVETGDDDRPPSTLVESLRQREQQLLQINVKLEEVDSRLQSRPGPPSRTELEQHIQQAAARLLDMNRESGVLLRTLLDGPIRAVPYQQFRSDKVVLRAEFRLILAKLLPTEVSASLRDGTTLSSIELLQPVDLVVDLFIPSNAPQYALAARALADDPKMRLVDIGEELGISKRCAHLAVQFGTAMREAGMTDPYVRLTERPARASRWRSAREPKPKERGDAA